MDEMRRMWLDLTLRPQVPVEIDLQPDNTVELSWPLPGESRATLLLTPDDAAALHKRLGLLLLMVER